MRIASELESFSCPEADIYNRYLNLDNKHILELGCGNADITRDIASSGIGRVITAMEVDEIAHDKNLQINDLPNVTFSLAGAENIPLDDESVDVVLMFKSLHHVPVDLMDVSLQEIARVLRKGGQAYISEPVFAGEFNEILRLFHDEQKVREYAFESVKKAVDEGRFKLVKELFFNTPGHYEDFAAFEDKVIKATHSQHELDENLYQLVRQKFERHLKPDGAFFQTPIRVDILQK